MPEPSYQEVGKTDIPTETRGDNCFLSVSAGETKNATQGVINNDFVKPLYWDIHLSGQSQFNDAIPKGHNTFIYVIEGELTVNSTAISQKQLAVLSKAGTQLEVKTESSARFLLVAGKPLNEPVARGGPFVMNIQEKIQQAFSDYKSGQLAGSFHD